MPEPQRAAAPAMSRGWRRPNPVFSPDYRILVEILTAARQRAGISQRGLATRLDRAQSHIFMIERGQRRVDLLEFYRLAHALGYAPSDLFREVADRLEALDAERATKA
jgi:transcriptional regulator with XRE-family HTH domain